MLISLASSVAPSVTLHETAPMLRAKAKWVRTRSGITLDSSRLSAPSVVSGVTRRQIVTRRGQVKRGKERGQRRSLWSQRQGQQPVRHWHESSSLQAQQRWVTHAKWFVNGCGSGRGLTVVLTGMGHQSSPRVRLVTGCGRRNVDWRIRSS